MLRKNRTNKKNNCRHTRRHSSIEELSFALNATIWVNRRLSGDFTSLHRPENDPCFGVKKPTTLAGGTQFMVIF